MAGLVAARAALRLFGFPRIRRQLETTRVRRARTPEFAVVVRRAVERASRSIPGSTCLPRAIVAARLLRESGLPAVFTIGVTRGPSSARPLDAHAWVTSGELVVAGDRDLTAYTELTRFELPE